MKRWIREFILEAVLILLCLFFAWRSPTFWTWGNWSNILSNSAIQGVIAFGMTMVIIAGEIDLSVGSAVGFASCMIAWTIEQLVSRQWSMGIAMAAGIAAALAVVLACAAVSGFLRMRFGVPTFISTLAWFLVLRGIAGQMTGGFSIESFPDAFNSLATGHFWGIPVPAAIFVAIFLIAQFIMGYTTFGRAVYAVGGNAESARLSGIPVLRVKIGVMMIVSALVVLAALMQSAQVMKGDPKLAEGWELDVIAAVIIGGTSLMGGAGRIWGTFVGVIFIGVLMNGLVLLDVGEYWKKIVEGSLILLAVLLNAALSERRTS